MSTGNLTVAVPSMLTTPEVNLTDDTQCREACPQLPSEDPFFSEPQPCVYTVRVTEPFKGSYLVLEYGINKWWDIQLLNLLFSYA